MTGKKKFVLSGLSIFGVFALAALGAYYYYFQRLNLSRDVSFAETPNLYSPVWRDSFDIGMVLPASCESGYEHSPGECATPICTVSFNPNTVVAGKNTTYYWNFSNNTAYYQTSCSGNLGNQEGPVPSYATYNGYNSNIYPKGTQTCSTIVRTAGGVTNTCSASVTVNPLGVNPEVSCPAGQNFADFQSLGTPPGGVGISDPVIGGWSNGDLTILMEAPYGYPYGNLKKNIWEKRGNASGSNFSTKFDWRRTFGDNFEPFGRPKIIDEVWDGNPGPVAYLRLVSDYVIKVYRYVVSRGQMYSTNVSVSNFGQSGPGSVNVPGVGTFKLTGRGPVMLQKCQSSQTLTVLKDGAGSGTVTSASNPSQPAQINCGATCSATFSYNASVTLTAAASGGSTFAGWSGEGCSGTGTCVVSMTQARSVTATFNPNLADLIPLNPAANSLVSGDTLSFSATIKNQGKGRAEASYTRMSIDLGNDGSFNVPSSNFLTSALNSGDSTTVTWSNAWSFTAGTHKLRIWADSTGKIAESNESNNILDWVFTVNQRNRAPTAVAKISIDDKNYANSIIVTKGVPTTIYLSADGSSDPDGWTDATNGVSIGGYLQWNSDLNQGAPTFETTFNNPASPGAISLGALTFDDAPGTYTYQVLQITDKQGAASNIAAVQVTVAVPLNVSKTGLGKGAITSSPAGINCNTYNGSYEQGLKPEFDMNNDGLFNMEDGDLVLIASVGRGCPPGKNCDIDGSGIVTSGDALLIGYYMPRDCSESYPVNTFVSLTATPDVGSVFSGWSGDSDCSDGSVTMSAAKTCIATFSVNQAPVAAAQISKDGVNYSNSITVTQGIATMVYLSAANSSDPDGWTDATNGVSNGGKCEWNSNLNQGSPVYDATISNPASASSCNIGPLRPDGTWGSGATLTFNDAPGTYTYQVLRITDRRGEVSNVATVSVTVQAPLTVTKSGTGSGTVTSAPSGISCGATYVLKSEFDLYADGMYINLDSVSDPGIISDPKVISRYLVGIGTCPPAPGKNCDVNNDGKITSSDALALAQRINGCTEPYNSGTSVILTATPSSGSTFSGWSGAGCSGTGSCTALMDQDQNVTATFSGMPRFNWKELNPWQ